VEDEVEKLLPVRVTSLNDIARLAASLVSMGQPTYIVKFKHDGKSVYGIFAIFRDYYKLYGLPIFYYYVMEKDVEDSRYVLVKSEDAGERVELSKTVKPGYIAVPIVVLAEMPKFVKVEV